MPAANGHDTRSPLAAAIVGQFIHKRMPRANIRAKQSLIQTPNTEYHQPYTDPAKDQDA